jgi:DNA-directed RNA polymerase I subunit RPA12
MEGATWPFCPYCGTILETPETVSSVSCSSCPFKANFQSLIGEQEQITRSGKKQKMAWVEEDNGDDNTMQKHATIDEPCPKCAHPELYFYTMQLRSVDEGSTVFYECIKCKHKFSQNN